VAIGFFDKFHNFTEYLNDTDEIVEVVVRRRDGWNWLWVMFSGGHYY
jgi:hypothetical protein